jgi:TPR repeat protein
LLAAETEIEALTVSAEQGDAESQFRLASCFDFGCDGLQDRAAAAVWYERAAEQGHANAQNSLGSLLMAGEGVTQDYEKAMEWYQAAADNGLPQGIHNLAYMYDLGLGVSEDNVRALQLYRTAAEGGHVEAMFNIGLMYAFGTDVQKDYETAYMWLDLARFYTQRAEDRQLKWQVRGYLDELERNMTAPRIDAAKSRSKAWYTTHGR